MILAVPPWVAKDLVPGLSAPDEFRSIVNAHFRFRAAAGCARHPGRDRRHGGMDFRLSTTASRSRFPAPTPSWTRTAKSWPRSLWADVAKALDIPCRLPTWQIVKEKRATFAATPAQDAMRPVAQDRLAQSVPGRRLDPDRAARHHRGRGAFGRNERRLWRCGNYLYSRGHEPVEPPEFADLEAAIRAATDAILAQQRADGHWVYELEADATIPAEYVLLVHYLAETPNLELERKIGVYLRRIQGEPWRLAAVS